MNLPTLLVLIALLALLAAVFLPALFARKKGRGGGCGCGCADCPSAGLCRPEQG